MSFPKIIPKISGNPNRYYLDPPESYHIDAYRPMPEALSNNVHSSENPSKIEHRPFETTYRKSSESRASLTERIKTIPPVLAIGALSLLFCGGVYCYRAIDKVIHPRAR